MVSFQNSCQPWKFLYVIFAYHPTGWEEILLLGLGDHKGKIWLFVWLSSSVLSVLYWKLLLSNRYSLEKTNQGSKAIILLLYFNKIVFFMCVCVPYTNSGTSCNQNKRNIKQIQWELNFQYPRRFKLYSFKSFILHKQAQSSILISEVH